MDCYATLIWFSFFILKFAFSKNYRRLFWQKFIAQKSFSMSKFQHQKALKLTKSPSKLTLQFAINCTGCFKLKEKTNIRLCARNKLRFSVTTNGTETGKEAEKSLKYFTSSTPWSCLIETEAKLHYWWKDGEGKETSSKNCVQDCNLRCFFQD